MPKERVFDYIDQFLPNESRAQLDRRDILKSTAAFVISPFIGLGRRLEFQSPPGPHFTPEQKSTLITKLSDAFQMHPEMTTIVWDENYNVAADKNFKNAIPLLYMLAVLRAETAPIAFLTEKTIPKDNHNRNGTIDRGFWQINSRWNEDIPIRDQYNFKKSTQWAVSLLYDRSLTTWDGTRLEGLPLRDRMWYAYKSYNGSPRYATDTLYLAEHGLK